MVGSHIAIVIPLEEPHDRDVSEHLCSLAMGSQVYPQTKSSTAAADIIEDGDWDAAILHSPPRPLILHIQGDHKDSFSRTHLHVLIF